MGKNLGYLAVSVGIAAGIAGAAGISYCLNQKRFVKVLPAQEKSEILEGREKASVRTSDVKGFVERRRRRAAEKRKMNQGKEVSL